jgi:hypothetical protein
VQSLDPVDEAMICGSAPQGRRNFAPGMSRYTVPGLGNSMSVSDSLGLRSGLPVPYITSLGVKGHAR